MNWYRTHIAAEGPRNASVVVTGAVWDLEKYAVPIFDRSKHFAGVQRVKLESAVWMLQEKLTLLLYWGDDTDDNFVLVMESRNYVRFDRGLLCPEDWDGTLRILPLNTQKDDHDLMSKHFTVVLDLDKL